MPYSHSHSHPPIPIPHPPNRPKDQHANPEWTPGLVPAAAQPDPRREGDVRFGLQEEQRNFPWQGQPGAQGRGKWISHSVNGVRGGDLALAAAVCLQRFKGHKAAEDSCDSDQLFSILDCFLQISQWSRLLV